MRLNQSLRDPTRRGRGRADSQAELEEPILGELFSVERLEQHAQTLAAAQVVTSAPRRGRAVGPRIAENGRVLVDSYRVLARAIKDERAITPAAEWLVDNFPIVDEQLREIRDDLPPDYYRELPKLAEGHLAGYPRVLGLAWAYIAHTDSRFDPESLRRMVRAYQGVEPLTIGELWATAISLRILLVDNLRRLAEQIVRSRAARQTADEWPRPHPCVGSRGRRSRRRPASSSSSACETRIRRSPPPSAGWRSFSRPRGPPPRRWSASSTSARRR
jgi:cyclic beta-1,2-glucan synthetase